MLNPRQFSVPANSEAQSSTPGVACASHFSTYFESCQTSPAIQRLWNCALGLEFISLDFAGHFGGESKSNDGQTSLEPVKQKAKSPWGASVAITSLGQSRFVSQTLFRGTVSSFPRRITYTNFASNLIYEHSFRPNSQILPVYPRRCPVHCESI